MGCNMVRDLTPMPVVNFTHLQVAAIGLCARDARVQGFHVDCRTLAAENVPRAGKLRYDG